MPPSFTASLSSTREDVGGELAGKRNAWLVENYADGAPEDVLGSFDEAISRLETGVRGLKIGQKVSVSVWISGPDVNVNITALDVETVEVGGADEPVDEGTKNKRSRP